MRGKGIPRLIVLCLALVLTLTACGRAAGGEESTAPAGVNFEDIAEESVEVAALEISEEEPETAEPERSGIDEAKATEAEGPETAEPEQNGTDEAEAGEAEETETAEPEQSVTDEAEAGEAEKPETAEEAADEVKKEAEPATAEEAPAQTEEAGTEQGAEPAPTTENARKLFIGDSRTIDMFADSDDEISGAVHDGITVYAKHGFGYDYMKGVVDGFGHENFDVLITWMGANDGGNFSNYEGFYNGLLGEGKTIIVCTVGPTDDNTLSEWDHPNYENSRMSTFNSALTAWAGGAGVRVIDLYGYISDNITIDTADGIHYTPRPTTAIWQYILGHI